MKYCENCGAPMEDSAQNCGQCGAPAKVSKKSGDLAKYLPIGIGAVVVVAILVCVVMLVFGGGFSNNKKPVNSAIKLMNKKTTDVDKFVEVALPDFGYDYYKKVVKIVKKTDMYEDYMDKAKDALEDMYDSAEDEFGDDWKISFDQKDKENLDKDDLEDIQDMYQDLYDDYIDKLVEGLEDLDDDDIEDIADELDIKEKDAEKLVKETIKVLKKFDDCKVTAGYTLKGKFVIEGEDGDEKSDTVEFNVIKINGDWMIDYLSIFNEYGDSIGNINNVIDEY